MQPGPKFPPLPGSLLGAGPGNESLAGSTLPTWVLHQRKGEVLPLPAQILAINHSFAELGGSRSCSKAPLKFLFQFSNFSSSWGDHSAASHLQKDLVVLISEGFSTFMPRKSIGECSVLCHWCNLLCVPLELLTQTFPAASKQNHSHAQENVISWIMQSNWMGCYCWLPKIFFLNNALLTDLPRSGQWIKISGRHHEGVAPPGFEWKCCKVAPVSRDWKEINKKRS